MPVERIAGVDDPRVDAYRDVPDPELVRARGLFIAEGRLVVRRVIEHAGYRVQSVLVNDAARRDLAPLLAPIAGTTPIYLCDAGDFQRITGYNIHRGRHPSLSTCSHMEIAPPGWHSSPEQKAQA